MDFDLILMDIRMPEMNGLEAAQLIWQQDKYRTLPIIALSANAFEEDRQTCLDAGMNNFILKPVAPDDLFKVLIKWLPKKFRQVLIEDEFTDEDNRFELVQSDDIDCVYRQLDKIPGLDYRTSLHNFMKNISEYLCFLKMFGNPPIYKAIHK